MSEPIPDPDFPPEDPVPPEPDPVEPGPELPVTGGWLDAAARAEADAKQYADERDAETLLVAGRMVPRNMDRPPTVEDGTDLIAGAGWNQYDPATNDLVQMWRWDGTAWQALDMSAEMIPVLDIGSATVGDLTGGRINVQDGPIIAGDPAGARVELTGDGFHAYDASGTETARIQGDGGEFVGGSFRTSDNLPGQVTLSDTANQGTPGIAVEPDDSTGYDVLPSIGPGPDHMSISGGVSTEGALAGAQFSANGTNIYHNGSGANGTGSWAAVGDGEAGLRYRPDRTNADYESAIRARTNDAVVYSEGPNGTGFITASPGSAFLQHVGPGDSTARSESSADATPEHLMLERKIPGVATRHRLELDDDGVWVKTVFGANPVSYNLLETAQDSGWQALTLASGISGSWSPAWRNKGGVIYLRGRVTKTGNWTAGWNVLVSDVGPAARPASHIQRAGATRGVGGTFLEVTTGGVLQVWFENATPGTTTVEMSPMFYPLG